MGLFLGLGAVMGGLSSPAMAQAQVVPEARAALPEVVRQAGVLKIATSYQWPPFASLGSDGKPDGIDIRLMTLLAAKLGLTPQFDDIKFPSIVPGVSSGRYDAGVNQIGITAERQKVVNFVPYFNSGYGLLVRKQDAALDINDLCGKTLVLTRGSAQVAVAEKLSADCVTAGKKEISFLFFPNSADTYLALSNGRGDGFLTARASGLEIAKGNDKLTMTSGMLPNMMSISGIVVAQNNKPLQDALRLALESAAADGSYQEIMADFAVPEGALSVEQIRNPPAP
ncbi:ABC transporter substrate-binding protein [Acetobacteraceae bacterium H6797]|nr:ABC transporter substrate-binding protein [Acetobacteraceae bacterium H6797]